MARVTLSDRIDAVVQLAIAEGNDVAEVSRGWSKVREVVHMRMSMIEAVRAHGSRLNLRHYVSKATPHDRADEGFCDDVASVCISFPLQKERGW